MASRWGHLEAARCLLHHGADVTAQNKYGWTPLRLALQGGHVDVTRLLAEHGADATGLEGQGTTPWQMADEDMDIACILENSAYATA